MEGLIADVNLIYTSPAWPFDGISLTKAYQLGKDDKGIYIYNNGFKQYYLYELIKMMFTPKNTNNSWDIVEEENPDLID